MPVYDWDNTTLREIGKIYDWDGTALREIGKAYDYDGTALREVFSGAEPNLFPNTVSWEVSRQNTRIYVTACSPSSITFKSDWYNEAQAAYVITTLPVDLTDFSTLTATFTISGINAGSGAYNEWYVRVNSAKSSYGGAYGGGRVDANGVHTSVLNVSGLTGEYYVAFGGEQAFSNASCAVNSIVLS